MNSFDDSDLNKQKKLAQEIQQAEDYIRPRMTREALERYGRIKFGQPQKALQALVLMAQMIETRKLSIVEDSDLKKILMRLSPKQKNTIIRK